MRIGFIKIYYAMNMCLVIISFILRSITFLDICLPLLTTHAPALVNVVHAQSLTTPPLTYILVYSPCVAP